MSRPTVEVTEAFESVARRVAYNPIVYVTEARALAEAILAAIPQPPRPLAVGDLVDRWEPSPGEAKPWLKNQTTTVVGFAEEAAVVLRFNYADGAVEYGTDTDRQYRVGESEPAPWPWEVAP